MIRRPPRSTLLSLHDALPIYDARQPAFASQGLYLAPNLEPFADDVADLVEDLGQVATGLPLQDDRSEEHTSELQSRQYLVCRLLLEKKKKNTVILATDKRITD